MHVADCAVPAASTAGPHALPDMQGMRLVHVADCAVPAARTAGADTVMMSHYSSNGGRYALERVLSQRAGSSADMPETGARSCRPCRCTPAGLAVQGRIGAILQIAVREAEVLLHDCAQGANVCTTQQPSLLLAIRSVCLMTTVAFTYGD